MMRGSSSAAGPASLTRGATTGTVPPVADIAKLLQEMRSNPGGVRFTDACKVVTAYFGAPRQRRSSHRVWKMPWAGDPRVNLQSGEGDKAKAYQVRQALEAIDKLLSERATSRGKEKGNEKRKER